MESENLSCIYCNREYDLDEVFIAYVRDSDRLIIITCCLKCSESSEGNTVPEQHGFWTVLIKTLDGYEVAPAKNIN